jgi:hypothetical protein
MVPNDFASLESNADTQATLKIVAHSKPALNSKCVTMAAQRNDNRW